MTMLVYFIKQPAAQQSFAGMTGWQVKTAQTANPF